MVDMAASVFARLKNKAAESGRSYQLSDFEPLTINTYFAETSIAEKIDATLSLMEFSSRMNGCYNIYYIANKFDFDGKALSEELKSLF